jgi:3-oxoacyl-(acyl-carrier-protein) synthase
MQTITTIRIADNALYVNGQQVFAHPAENAEVFFKALYHYLKLEYPKFFKMDSLSKLGFLAVEALVQHNAEVKSYADDDIAVVFGNAASSLDTDQKYWNGVAAAEPVASPALFVYTLPNIVQGEIAIRHKWYGENMFLVLDSSNKNAVNNSAELLLETCKAKACVAGWVDYLNGAYEAEVALVRKPEE